MRDDCLTFFHLNRFISIMLCIIIVAWHNTLRNPEERQLSQQRSNDLSPRPVVVRRFYCNYILLCMTTITLRFNELNEIE